jgi:hypothetical protein
MLQVFYLDVTLLQVYVPNVLFVSGVCCIVSSKCCKTDLDIGMEEAWALDDPLSGVAKMEAANNIETTERLGPVWFGGVKV